MVLPLAVLWAVWWRQLKDYWRVVALNVGFALAFAVPWDFLAIRTRIWYFTEPQVVGVWLLGLPVEEWLFISLVTALLTTVAVLAWRRWGQA